MCGRYTLIITLEELMHHYMVEQHGLHAFSPRYNIAPGQMVPAILHDGRRLRAGQLKWGLVPSWSKTEKDGFKLINARAETLAEKPAFRSAFQKKRCIIPADGFYEWQRRPDGTKQPYRIVVNGGKLFSLAGLYETWLDADGNKLGTCTIITTEPNKLMSGIHDRMPVILKPGDEQTWLGHRSAPAQLQTLLRPFANDEMDAYPVGQAVGNVRNDDASLIKRLGSV